MRRILFVVVTGFALGMLSGCLCCQSSGHTHGICDCDQSEDPCYTRAPWSGTSAPVNGLKQMPSADKAKP